jgi:hypothetical protein
MRLSWYSDTGVAVFSIWQGGTCTGTFRLPIEDLSRMVEALQRGPRGAGLPAADSTGINDLSGLTSLPGRGAEGAPAPYAEYSTGQHVTPVSGPPPSYRGRDDSPPYREDPLTSPSFRDEARSGRYRPQSPAPASGPSFTPSPSPGPSFTPSPSYRDTDDSPSYREDPLTSPSFRDQGRSDRYRSSSYPDRDRDYQPGDDYPSGWRDGDSGDHLAPEPPRSEGYRGRRYVDDPFQSNYPDQPPGGSRPYSDPDQDPRSHRGRPSRT